MARTPLAAFVLTKGVTLESMEREVAPPSIVGGMRREVAQAGPFQGELRGAGRAAHPPGCHLPTVCQPKGLNRDSCTLCPSGTGLRGVEMVSGNAKQGLGRSAGAQHSSSRGRYLPQHLPCPGTAGWLSPTLVAQPLWLEHHGPSRPDKAKREQRRSCLWSSVGEGRAQTRSKRLLLNASAWKLGPEPPPAITTAPRLRL